MPSPITHPHKPENCLEISPSAADGGHYTGKDPRKMPLDVLLGLKHPTVILEAIQAKCLECSCGEASEVRKCVMADCPLWPLRMGTNPYRAKTVLTDARLEAKRAHMRKIRAVKTGT